MGDSTVTGLRAFAIEGGGPAADGQAGQALQTRQEREIRAPIPGKRNILVTSALPYVNNVPHLGNIIGCVLSADVYARYCRRRGYNVIYMCGTDEYGTATETKALEEGISPKEICDKYHAIHKDIYDWFDIDFDKFGRTSTPQQTEICQAIFKKLLEKDRLSQNVMEQPYCDTCSRFLADRFAEGTCPHCGYDGARGDQCDNCSKLLNPVELINPRCKVCGNPPRTRETEHLFLKLPELKDQLEEYVRNTSEIGGWSQNSVQTTNAWIRDGLKECCITRDLKWGVPVPLEKYKDKVFYVWFDAPIGYISITANYTSEWEKWWKSPKDVELVQFMGKDNVPFHTVIFPCTLIGTGDPWTLMRTICVTEYLNYEAGKFSKSRGVGVFGNDVKTTNIPVEVWRYYLLTNRPEVSDTLFTWADLQAKQNNELLKNLGNFVHRSLSFLVKPTGEGYGGVIPEISGAESHELTATFASKVGDLVKEYVEAMEKVKLKQGLRTAMNVSSLGNLYLQDSKFWKLYKEDPSACAIVIKTSVGLVHLLATLLEPFIPSFSHKVLQQLNLPPSSLSLSDENGDLERAYKPWELIPAYHQIGVPSPIFFELKDEDVEKYRLKFGGSQAGKALINEGAKAEWEALRALVQVIHEHGGQIPSEEISLLLGNLLRLLKKPDFCYIEQGKRMPKSLVGRSENAQAEAKTPSGQEDREYQRLIFTAIGNLFTRAGTLVSKENWALVIKVLRVTLESMVSTKLVEDAAASRSYAAVLRCVHVVLSDPKNSLGEHVSGFVGAFRVFFMYGLPNFGSSLISNKAGQGQGATMAAGSWRDAKVKTQENGAYRPPHLRGKPSAKVGKAGKSDVHNLDLERQVGRGGGSSDSELSDSDGQHEEGDRYKSSKVRTNAILSIQALARTDPKVLHAHWVVLLPTHDVLQPRPFQATLLTILLFDPIVKVRMTAASTIAVMFEGPARSFLQAAEYKEISRSKSFTTLSSSLGQLVIQLLIGLLHVVVNETHGGILVATLKALSLLVSASPFSRLPAELLPYVLRSVHQRARDFLSSAVDQSNVMCAAVNSLGAVLSCTPPSATIAANLVTEAPPVSATWTPSLNGPSRSHLLLPDLISYTLPPASPAVRVEAFQALKAAVHTYPLILSDQWESISRSIMGTIAYANGQDSLGVLSNSFSSLQTCRKGAAPVGSALSGQTARLADDKVVHSAIKLLDEFLRATCGYQGTDDSFEDQLLQPPAPYLVPKPTKLLMATASSLSMHVIEGVQSEEIDSQTAVGFWLEALNKHLPPTLTHTAPMVRGAALTCFAGLTSTLFSSLPSEKQDNILSSLISAAWNDDTPSVRSAACRAIGVVMGFPQVAGRKEKLDMAVDVVVSSISDTSVSVRITASWALANICDALRNISETYNLVHLYNLSGTISLAPLAECALKAAKDCDKVRANAVRALGNLARFANFGGPSEPVRNSALDVTLQYPHSVSQPLEPVDQGAAEASRWLGVMVQTLVSCVTTGNVKVQWNVCHALGNLFLNKTVCLARMTWVPSVFSILLLLLRDSANYKIRIHSAAALAVPATREDYGESYSDVVRALVHALDCIDSEHESAPTSFKYNKALREQLTTTILHVLGLSIPEDFFCLKDFLLKRATFLQDFLTSLCTSEGKSCMTDTDVNDSGFLDQMAETSLDENPSYKGFGYDEKPLPPPKEHRRYGLQMNDSMLSSNGGQAYKILYLRLAIRALAEMYRYGGVVNATQKLENLIAHG